MYDDDKHEIGYLQVWSHMRRRNKFTGSWELVPSTHITRNFLNKKHYGWVSILDPELVKFKGVFCVDDWNDEWYNDNDCNSDMDDYLTL